MTSPNELLSTFLESNEVSISTIHTCSINENSNPGKFDAPTDWLAQLDGIIQQPVHSTIEATKDIHSNVFIEESSEFEDHFIEVDCSIHSMAMIYRYIDIKITPVLFSSTESEQIPAQSLPSAKLT